MYIYIAEKCVYEQKTVYLYIAHTHINKYKAYTHVTCLKPTNIHYKYIYIPLTAKKININIYQHMKTCPNIYIYIYTLLKTNILYVKYII